MAETSILLTLAQARLSGFLGGDEARRLCSESPRLFKMLCDGLSGQFGPVPPRRFMELADERRLTADVLERALA